jgi:hypothetical protein
MQSHNALVGDKQLGRSSGQIAMPIKVTQQAQQDLFLCLSPSSALHLFDKPCENFCRA